MRFAINLPNFGDLADPRVVVELAIAAESCGWDGFFIWDHIVVADAMPVGDPWVQLAAVAQATDRIVIGPMVTPVPRRRPWVLARQAVSLDHLSGGRLILGVGLGFPPVEEFGTFGEPTDPHHRASLLDEGLEVIVGMWSGEPFEYRGNHFTVVETSFAPSPIQRPRIPIWVAGMWPNRAPFRRAGRFDGVFPIAADGAALDPAVIAEIVGLTGRDDLDVTVGGGPDADLEALEAAGVTWYQVGPYPGAGLEDVRGMVEAGPPA